MAPVRTTALIYDFDGTLARGNMQETSFIPALGMTPAEFWNDTVRPQTIRSDGDDILMYMQLMLQTAREKGINVTRRLLQDHGRDVALFEGLRDESWFDRINAFGADYGLTVQHFILSSGLAEMIAGCPIARRRGGVAGRGHQLHHQDPVPVPHQQARAQQLGARAHQPLRARRGSPRPVRADDLHR
jgi:hypothetical protein